jgi:predicted esterase
VNLDPHGAQPILYGGAKLDKAGAAVILLHGRGSSAENILGLKQAFDHPRVAYLVPQAAGNSWYPNSFLAARDQNEPWLTSALRKVESTVALAASANVPLRKIVLCGFSQGACLATEFVANHPARYGGLIAYTGGLIGPPRTKFHFTGTLDRTPAFFGSADPDPHVPWDRVEESAQILSQMGAMVVAERYEGREHIISMKELAVGREIVHSLFR